MARRRSGVVVRILVLCLAGCPGSDPGGAAPAPGAAASGPATPAPSPSPNRGGAARAAGKTLLTGGDADFDGDGKLDARTTIDGDTRTTVFYGEPGKVRLTLVARADHVDLQGDFNGDGTIDFKHTGETVAGVRTQRSTWDTDFDGVVDETETLTFTGAPGRGKPVTVTVRHERRVHDPETGETTTRVSERTGDGVAANGEVSHLAGFPEGGERINLDPSRDNIRVVVQDAATPGGCDEAQRRQLQDALMNLDRQIDCVATANTTAAAALRYAVEARSIDIACAPSTTSDFGAADVGPMFHGPEREAAYRMNIDPKTFALAGFSETFLHEFMHLSGYTHADPAEEAAKTDRVNSCASYCSGCIKGNIPSETPGQDCARCSEPGRKEQCGIKKGKVRSRACHRDHLAACLAGEFKTAVDCEVCLRGAVRLCDDTPVGEDGMPLCCERCPAGTQENLECTSLPEWRVNTCFDKPPACRGPLDVPAPVGL